MKRKQPTTSKLFGRLNIGKLGVWHPTFIIAAVAAVAASGFYLFRLGRHIGAGNGELHTIQQLSDFGGLAANPLLLPYKLVASIALQLPGDPLLQVRLAAVFLALVTVGLFLTLAKRWHGAIGGLAATILMATSGWLLHTGRYGAGYIALLLVVIGLMNLVVWLNNTANSDRTVAVLATVGGLALFVPGGIWFLAAAVVLCWHSIARHVSQASARSIVIGLGIGLVLVGGLLAALFRDTSLIRQWLALPEAFPGLIDLAKQAALSASAFIFRGPATPEIWLPHTPILDAASSVLLIFGIIFYSRHLRNVRTQLLLSFAGIGVVLTALNGAPALGFLVPTAYLIIACGFAYFLHQWKKIFPRNPIAEATALTFLGILVLCIIGFHGQRYFVAWRYSPQTAETYRQAAANNGDVPKPLDRRTVPYLIQ